MLTIQNLNAYYGKHRVLSDLSLTIDDGELVGIFGHNGAGKTTLLRSCVGDIDGVMGTITYRGHEIRPGQVHVNVRAGIGFVPQGNNVFRDLTVEENLQIAGLRHSPTCIETVYGVFPLLEERKRQQAGSLSGGQQQMLALGLAFMTRPTLLFLDEPTTGLAPIIVKDMLNAVKAVNQESGTTVVIVEQNVQATLKQVTRAVVVKSGRIIFDGPSRQLLDQVNLWELF